MKYATIIAALLATGGLRGPDAVEAAMREAAPAPERDFRQLIDIVRSALNTAINATEGYGVGFGLEQYDLMGELLRTMKGKAVVSVNDIPAMRQAFKGLHMKQLQVNYTVGASGQGRGPKHELVICNFKPSAH